MIGKGTKLHSIIRFKCPHCHEGEFFVDRNPYNIAKAGDLLETCPACGRKYEPEPGFYYGGMYVAYALAVALFVTVYLAITILWPASAIGLRVGLVLLALVLFAPLVYALSKIIWANLFLSYKGPASAPDQQ